ncbi:MAG: hypothetical protein HRT58_00885 [Crocinitomicaceae bacterium]|nr:hypothetical protein [Flavobacteriales bacterium]NQZ34177.1 hypothetical protein [Crocinitomicaceae bacterium]
MEHRKYNRQAHHAADPADLVIPQALFNDMWELFVQIGKFWSTAEAQENFKSDLLVFMNNRIGMDPCYLYDYKNAAEVIKELINELGEEQGYESLFTDKSILDDPPTTLKARARQKVSNEFIVLYISLGGFKEFGAENSLGYIGGANIKGKTPYRTID